MIGLPSALAKRPTGSHSTRWTDADDDLRRRDELQARQKEFRESEAREVNDQPPSDTAISSGKSPGSDFHLNSAPSTNSNDGESALGAVTKDLPLYSPMNMSLFTYLWPKDSEEYRWLSSNSLLDSLPSAWLLGLSFLEVDLDATERTQLMVYEALRRSTKFRSEHSLLPYLLFSSYSPLKLEQPGTSILGTDSFPYKKAFEDLLRTNLVAEDREGLQAHEHDHHHDADQNQDTAQNREGQLKLLEQQNSERLKAMRESQEVEAQKTCETPGFLRLWEVIPRNIGGAPRNQSLWKQIVDEDEDKLFYVSEGLGKAVGDFLWIDKLQRIGLLQPREVVYDSTLSPTSISSKKAQTEQELYDHFLRSSTSFPGSINESLKTGEEKLSAIERYDDNFMVRNKDGVSPQVLELTNRHCDAMEESLHERSPRTSHTQANVSPTQAPENSDRVISSSTTSEQIVHEDGTVETSMTVVSI